MVLSEAHNPHESSMFTISLESMMAQILKENGETLLYSILSSPQPSNDQVKKQVSLVDSLLLIKHQDLLLTNVFEKIIDNKIWHCKHIIRFFMRMDQRSHSQHFSKIVEGRKTKFYNDEAGSSIQNRKDSMTSISSLNKNKFKRIRGNLQNNLLGNAKFA